VPKDKDEEKMVRMALAAVLALPIILARELKPQETNIMGPIDTALDFADELIRKTK
jgi:hypothetical protein